MHIRHLDEAKKLSLELKTTTDMLDIVRKKEIVICAGHNTHGPGFSFTFPIKDSADRNNVIGMINNRIEEIKCELNQLGVKL